MEIKDFGMLMRRGIRYLIAGLILGAALGLVVSVVQRPVYEASTQVLIRRPSLPIDIDVLPLDETQTVEANSVLVKTKPVRDAAGSEVGTKISAAAIRVKQWPNSLVMEIDVQDTDAERAAAMANALVKVLIATNDSILSARYSALENALNEQIDQVQRQIDILKTQFNQMNDASIQAQLTQVNQQIDDLGTQISGVEQDINGYPPYPSALEKIEISEKQAQLEQLRTQLTLYQQVRLNLTYIGKPADNGTARDDPSLTNLQSTLDEYQQIYLNLLKSLEENRSDHLQRSTPAIIQIEPAVRPTIPVRPQPVLYVLFGSLVGLSLSGAAILVADHVNNPLKTALQTEEVLGLPVLGIVSDGRHDAKGLLSLQDPLSVDADGFRALGAGLELLHATKNLSTLMVSNAGPGEGKSTIAANLGIVYTQQDRRVILLDGDLRTPHLHGLFGAENQHGLADLIKGSGKSNGLGHVSELVDGLTLIPSGVAANHSATYVDAEKWGQLLRELQKPANLVIVEAPSSELADAQTLASKVDAVLLVVRLGQTPVDSALATLKRFRLAGATTIGVVLNHATQDQMVTTQIFSQRISKLQERIGSYVGRK